MIAILPLLVFDLSLTDGGLAEVGTTKQWEWGTASVGPVGQVCWGTVLDGFYLNESRDAIEIPALDLSGLARPVLVIDHYYDTWSGDVATIEVDDGSGWRTVEPVFGYPTTDGFSGPDASWRLDGFDLSNAGDAPRIRLVFQSNLAVAGPGWFVREIALYDGDPLPPRITPVTLPMDTQPPLVGGHLVELEIIDDVAVTDAVMSWAIDGAAQPDIDGLASGNVYGFEIPSVAPDNVITWSVEATDGTGTSRYPESGDEAFRVFLPPPRNLQGPDVARLVATDIELSWDPPNSNAIPVGYRVYEEEAGFLDVADTWALVDLDPDGTHVFSVSAMFVAGEGDRSESLALDPEVPELIRVEPEVLFPGERRYMEIEGASLYLNGNSTLDLGPEVTVGELEVVDVRRLRAPVEVEQDAPAGGIDLQITGAWGRFTFPEALAIGEAADAPRIVSVEPDMITQGRSTVMTVTANAAFATPVTIDGGEELVLTSDVQVDGNTVTFELTAGGIASVGPRSLVVDDGDRLWTAEIEVIEYTVPPQRVCSTGSTGPIGGLWLLLALARRRR